MPSLIRALTPYTTPRRALMYSAAKTAYSAYRSSPFLRRAAASTISRAWLSYKKSRARTAYKSRVRKTPARRMVGKPMSGGKSKTRQTAQLLPDVGDAFDSRTLYAFDLTGIPQGSEPSMRERDIVNLKGFKVCLEIVNVTPGPIYYNFAIISPKTDVNLDPREFFRSYSNQRGTDFESPNITSLDYHCRPINTDNFSILHHKRYVLTTSNLSSKGEVYAGNASVRCMRYFKVNRQIAFKRQIEGDGEFASTPIFFVHWAAIAGDGTETPPVPTFRADLRIVTYFRDVV